MYIQSQQVVEISAITSPVTVERSNALFSSTNYGEYFDVVAKERMASGCRMLEPWIHNRTDQMKGNCIEFGPFLNPLLEPENLPHSRITFVDGDSTVTRRLREKFYDRKSVNSVCINLNSPLSLAVKFDGKFNTIVASQILNYIDYRKFFEEVTSIAENNALLFLNNVIDYGIPELFSNARPKNDQEIFDTLKYLGWAIEESVQVQSLYTQQVNPRLLIVARKIFDRCV